ncbi:MAG: nicotinate-nucleotide adenylyltransferase [Hormoscilla sp. SP5CHS1]|nr:nicotinate-nucleotide adenylyltransferase [Hormoscilla sp. SP12CHS1]MBC6454974.1 nicotinate-nucleotide adenylyltransferase [Hormoscilla sp. SP5CHS1]
MNKKIALFGTSADPPTTGHQTIINWLSQHYDWVAVWASDNPMKVNQSCLSQRSAMLMISIEEINWRQNIRLHPELSSPRTLDSVAKAKVQWPEAELTLAIGSDLVRQLPRWYRVADILPQVKLLVVPRPGYTIDRAGLDRLLGIGAVVEIANINAPAVSSTAYRERGDTKALTRTIQDYIDRQQLYDVSRQQQASKQTTLS